MKLPRFKRATALTLVIGALLLACSGTTTARGTMAPDKVVYLGGDSITAAGYFTDGSGWRDGYPALTAAMLCGTGCPQVHAIGNGGQCLAAVFSTCPQQPTFLDSFTSRFVNAVPKPTEILVEIGLNDLGNIDTQWLKVAFTQLDTMCISAQIKCIYGTITPLSQARQYFDPPREIMNTWLRATFPSRIAEFDFALRKPGTTILDPVYDYGDGVHPNAYGALRMAQAAASVL